MFSGFQTFIHLNEFYTVSIKKDTEFYPFGGEGPVPYYYRSAELYSNVNLTYGIIFFILLGLGIWNLMTNNLNGKIIFGLTLLLIVINFIHETIG